MQPKPCWANVRPLAEGSAASYHRDSRSFAAGMPIVLVSREGTCAFAAARAMTGA